MDMRTLQMGSQLRILEDLLSLPSPQLQIQDYRYLHFFLTLSSSLLIMPVGCISLKPTLFWAPSLVPSFLHSSSPSSLSSPSRPFSFWYLSQCCEAFLSTCPYNNNNNNKIYLNCNIKVPMK